MSTIAFIGLGNMGGPMAANLVKAGHRVVGTDVSPAAVERHVAAGGAGAASIAEAVREADVVVTMLPSGREVSALYGGDKGIIASAKAGALLIDSSTIDVDTARATAKAAAERGLAMIDAPVSGGVGGASAGHAHLHVRRRGRGLRRGQALSRGHGQDHRPCRRPGERPGRQDLQQHDPRHHHDCHVRGFRPGREAWSRRPEALRHRIQVLGQSWSLTTYCPVPGPVPTSPANRGYQAGFTAAMMLKDLKLAQDAARSAGAVTPLGAEAAALYGLYSAQGEAGTDFSGIVNFLRGK
jgi:3-hydroxyisobutyrate dehydrogenase